MKVLYILHRSSINDGASRSFLSMLERLIYLGIDPTVVIPDNGSICASLSDFGVRYKICKCRASTYPKIRDIQSFIQFIPIIIFRHLMNLTVRRRLKTICYENEIQLIHTNVGTIHQGYLVAKKINIPHVWHIREYQEIGLGLKPFPSIRSSASLS